MKDEGCWTIQLVSGLEPWLGTRKVPFKEHRFYPILENDFTTLKCSTCGMVRQRDGNVISVVDPVLEPAREPTAEELASRKGQ